MSENQLLFPKTTVAFLLIFGFVAVIFGWRAWKNDFKFALVFNQVGKKTSDISSNVSSSTVLDFNNPVLRIKDTDQDGLTDWEELNIYKTSPYIADTDSDGISDGDEVKQKSDPLCAEGKNCLSQAAPLTLGASSTANSLATELGATSSSTLDLIALKNLSVSQLRQLLLDRGYTKAQLDQLNDQQLSEVWQQALGQLSSNK
jgi:hypothetical protein